MTTLFISYSRKDKEFAQKLNASLEGMGFDSWVDWDDIPPTADWWEQIQKGIESADTFLFLLSPDSAKSEVCGREIDHAVKNGKRMIPIVVREVSPNDVHTVLTKLNWIFFRENDDFNVSIQKLEAGLKTDLAWVETHRRLQVKALEWDKRKDGSLLLRGKDLQDAELQLATNTSKDPSPTDLQREYVLESRQAADRQRRIITGISVAGVIVMAALTVFGFIQAGRATANADESQRNASTAQAASTLALNNASTAQAASTLAFNNAATAQANEQLANERANIAMAGEFSVRANMVREKETNLAMLLGIEAFRLKDNNRTRATLQDNVLYQPNLRQYLFGHSHGVTSVAISPDGNIIASASSIDIVTNYGDPVQWEIILWNAVTGQPISEPLIGHRRINSLAFSPDGKILASGEEGSSIILWDVNTRKPIGEPITAASAVSALEFSPDGKLLASSLYHDKTIVLWNVQTGKPLDITFTGDSPAYDIDFSPDGKTIASADDSGATLWDTQTGKPIGEPFIAASERYSDTVGSVAFSPDGETLAFFTSNSNEINLWNLETHQLIGKIPARAHDIAFMPDGKTLITAFENITRWDVSTSLDTGVVTYQPIGQPWATGASSSCIAISPDGKTLVSGNEDGTVTLWRLQTYLPVGKSLIDGLGNISGASVISPDGGTLAVVQRDSKTILLWDIAGQRLTGKILLNYDVSVMAFSPDGRMLATNGSDAQSIIFWDLKTGKPIGQPLVNNEGTIFNMVFSPDSKQIVTAGYDVRLWDVETHQMIKQIAKNQLYGFEKNEKTSQSFLAARNDLSSGYFAASSILLILLQQNRGAFWKITAEPDILPDVTGKPRAGGRGPNYTKISFSPDGNLIAFINAYENRAVVWDSQKDKSIKIPNDFGNVYSMAFSPDGSTLVTAGDQIAFWDTQSWKPVGLTIMGNLNVFYNLAISPDGTMLAATAGEKSITLWDVHSRQPVGQPILNYLGSEEAKLLFNPADNGKSIISFGCGRYCTDESVILWDLDPQSWVEKICERVGRNFTYDEWEQFFPGMNYRKTCEQWPIHPTVVRAVMEQAFSNLDDPQKAKTATDKVTELLKGDTTVADPDSESKQLVDIFTQEQLIQGSTALDAGNIKSMIFLVHEAIGLGLNIDQITFNRICWHGSIEGYAQDVLQFCEQAVSLAPDDAYYRDSRGLARALTGDFAGAILDFQYYVDTVIVGDLVKQRQQWILDLQAGKNPFTPEVLEMLKGQ